MISDEEKERVRQATDFQALVAETVELRRRGSDWWGCCPFHHEKSPSFHINPTTGLWKCFGCGAGGDVFSYVMKRENLDFADAIRYLADKAGIELNEDTNSYNRGPKNKRLFEALAEAQKFYSTMLFRGRGPQAAAAREYLSGRGFGSDVCKRWGIGFAPGHESLIAHLTSKGFTKNEMIAADLALQGTNGMRDRFYNRVMFPILDERSRCIGFGGRVLTDAKPKYLNTRETQVFHKSKNTFAFDRAKETIVAKNQAIVVEGYTDVIAMHEAGITNVVATLGTALTEEHVRLLSRFADTIIFMFDGDAAGKHAAERSIKFIEATKSDLRCVVLPNNLDPKEYIDQYGAASLEEHLAQSRSLIDFVFDIRLATYNLSVPGQKKAAFEELSKLLSVFKDSILLDDYATKLADALNLDFNQAKKAIIAAGSKVQNAPAVRDYYEQYAPVADPYDEYLAQSAAVQQEPQAPVELSKSEKKQVEAEHDLLSLLVQKPDFAARMNQTLSQIDWMLPQDKQVCDMLLAAQPGQTPAMLAALITEAVPEALNWLGGTKMTSMSELSFEDQVRFSLTVIEIESTNRQMQKIIVDLKTQQGNESVAQKYEQYKRLQERLKKLEDELRVLASQTK